MRSPTPAHCRSRTPVMESHPVLMCTLEWGENPPTLLLALGGRLRPRMGENPPKPPLFAPRGPITPSRTSIFYTTGDQSRQLTISESRPGSAAATQSRIRCGTVGAAKGTATAPMETAATAAEKRMRARVATQTRNPRQSRKKKYCVLNALIR